MADRGRGTGLMDEVLTIRMHTKVTKGGRNLSFGALVAVGNGNGRVGLGYGKAPGVPMAIEKGNKRARQDMLEVPLIGDTVCHEQVGEHKASRVLIRPAAPGTGVKAGATVRAIMQVLGVHNVLTKSLGRNNPINLARAAMNALQTMRSVKEVERLRGAKIDLKHPQLGIEEKTETPPEQAPPAESAETEKATETQEAAEQEPTAPQDEQETSETQESGERQEATETEEEPAAEEQPAEKAEEQTGEQPEEPQEQEEKEEEQEQEED